MEQIVLNKNILESKIDYIIKEQIFRLERIKSLNADNKEACLRKFKLLYEYEIVDALLKTLGIQSFEYYPEEKYKGIKIE